MAAMDQIPPEQLAKLAGEDLSHLTKNIVIAFTVIAFVSVCLRIYTRLRYQAAGWEDHTIVLAMVRPPQLVLFPHAEHEQVFSIATGVCQVLRKFSS
jgi:hypothetical protein